MDAPKKLLVDLTLAEGDPDRERLEPLAEEEIEQAAIDTAENDARREIETTRTENAEAIRARLEDAIDALRSGIVAIEGGTLFATAKAGEKKYLIALGRAAAGLSRLAIRKLDETD